MDIVKIIFDADWNFQFFINKWLVLILLVAGLFYFKLIKRIKGKEFEINEAEIGIGNQKIKIKPNYEDMQIAYKLWIEVSTRKIGLDIDYENDVLLEVYNSWYEFFKITRELIKNIPISRVRNNESTQKIVIIAIEVLNKGLRPHLTSWQAKYRRWYQVEVAKEENKLIPPQEIQRKYPHYEKLVEDMKKVNQELINYRNNLRKIAIEK